MDCCNASKLRETPKAASTKLTWKHVNGREQNSGMVIISQMTCKRKWAIRSQDPKPDRDEGMGKIQRLDGSGLEESNPLR